MFLLCLQKAEETQKTLLLFVGELGQPCVDLFAGRRLSCSGDAFFGCHALEAFGCGGRWLMGISFPIGSGIDCGDVGEDQRGDQADGEQESLYGLLAFLGHAGSPFCRIQCLRRG